MTLINIYLQNQLIQAGLLEDRQYSLKVALPNGDVIVRKKRRGQVPLNYRDIPSVLETVLSKWQKFKLWINKIISKWYGL